MFPPSRSARSAQPIPALRPARPVLLGLTLALALAAPAAARPLRQAADGPPPGTYELVETRADRPWSLTAGRFGQVLDVSSAPEGTRYVLDAYQGAVHALAADGTPLRVMPLRDLAPLREPVALDVGFDGKLYLLSTCRGCLPRSAVDRLTPEGLREARLEMDESYTDVAQREDGRLYLSRPQAADAIAPDRPAVDVYDAAGGYQESVWVPEMGLPIRVDLARDGRMEVLQTTSSDPNQGGGGGGGGRGPRPPPGPSSSVAGPAQDAEPEPGVLRFAADHVLTAFVPFTGGIDVTVGPGGSFVSGYGRILPIGEDERLTAAGERSWTGRPSLDAPADGRLLAGLDHCSFQGLLHVDAPAARPAAWHLSGALDRPELEGPARPARVGAGEEARVLQAPFSSAGARPDVTWLATDPPPAPGADFIQSAQSWSADGALESQLGHCAGSRSGSRAIDLALDGTDVYLVDASCVTHRPDDAFPRWDYCPRGLWGADVESRLRAVSADAGRVAVLDAGAGAVIVLDRDGTLLHAWTLGEADQPQALAMDLALDGDTVWLAYRGEGRVEARALDGGLQRAWATLDAPVALAIGPEGDVFTLGRGGAALRYAPDGQPRAWWTLPREDADATDLAVDDAGRVHVPFAVLDESGSPARIEDAGVWLFAPAPEAPAPPAPGGCPTSRDKRAAPARLPLGDRVTVRLDVDGACPGEALPLHLAIVFDTSRSMGWNYVLDEGKAAVLDLFGSLDPARARVTLVTFDDEAVLASPASSDLAGLGRRVAALRARGDTRMGAGIDLARRQLAAAGGPANETRAMLLVSDGVPYDQTASAIAEAGREGLQLEAWLWDNGQDRIDDALRGLLESNGGRVLDAPTQAQRRAFADALHRDRAQPGLFERIELRDEIPRNMRYIADSARPAARYDAAEHALVWELAAVSAAEGVRLAYQLEPLEVGLHPTNVRADADYRDATGREGRIVFPVPEVEVYAPRRVYLPLLLREHCLPSRRPVDVVLVLDTSSSMADAAPGGGTKLEAAVAAAGDFVGLLGLPRDRAAVVAFQGDAQRLSGLSGERDLLLEALGRLRSTPGTRIDLGLVLAERVLREEGRAGARPVVVLLTDGRQNGASEPVRAAATRLDALGARVFAIGLGADVEAELLRAVAGAPDRYYASPSAADLAGIYGAISERIACE